MQPPSTVMSFSRRTSSQGLRRSLRRQTLPLDRTEETTTALDDETLYPFEVVLRGTPVSAQSKSAKHRDDWKNRVRTAALAHRESVYELGFLDDRSVAITIFYFPADPMIGDIDNIVKPIMDALIGVAYLDDAAAERVVVQKFEPAGGWEFMVPSDRLAAALNMEAPAVYVRVEDDRSWRLIS